MTTPTTPAITTAAKVDLKTFALSHAIWIVGIVIALVVGNIALKEHDARVAAEAQIKVSEANVKTLQQQIAANDAQAAQKVQVITKIVHDLGPAPTTSQIVAAVPELTDAPLNARVIPSDPADISVAAVPFLQFVQQAATDKINLAACTSDLGSEKGIAAQKDTEIAALKKKPSLWKRVASTAKTVGVGIGIGLFLGAHAL